MRAILVRALAWTIAVTNVGTRFAQAQSVPAAPVSDPNPSITLPGGQEPPIRYDARFFASRNPKTALDIVHILPGFTFSAGDATVRGFTAAAGNVLIDGTRPADKQFTLDQVLERIPADQVDYVEIIRGGAPGIEMLGQTVVADIVRKKTARSSFTLTASTAHYINGYDTPSLTLEGTRPSPDGKALVGAISVSRYVDANNSGGPQIRLDRSSARLAEGHADTQAHGMTAFSYGVYETPAWSGKLRLNTNISWTDWTHDERDTTTWPTLSSTTLQEKLGGPLGAQMTGEVGARFGREFPHSLSSESTASLRLKGQNFTSNLDAPGVTESFTERDRSGEALARTDLRQDGRSGWSTEFSAEAAYNWLDTTSAFAFSGVTVPLPNSRAAASELRNEIAAQANWLPVRSTRLEVGIRFEKSAIASDADTHQHKTLRYAKPRVAVTVTPDSSDQLRLRLEREVGQLDFTTFVAASALDTGSVHAGNTSLVPQQDWVFEAAFERRLGSEGALVLTWRHLWISDAIDRVPVIDPSDPTTAYDAPGNIGSGSEDALISSLTWPLDAIGIVRGQLKAAGTFYWSRVTDPTTGAQRPISGLAEREYSIELRQDLPARHAAWGASLVTPCWSATANTKNCTESDFRFREIDAYRADPALNLYVEYQPRPGTSLRVEANNVLRRRYDRTVESFAGPRDEFGLAYREDRRLRSSTSILISLRKLL